MKHHSDGQAGERFAQYIFSLNRWTMYRSQPEAKILHSRGYGKYLVVFCKGGISDYTGYTASGNFVACEVKEATGNTMPCSRLEPDQREFMRKLPEGAAWVGIYWRDRGEFKIYQFKEKGSYKRKKA